MPQARSRLVVEGAQDNNGNYVCDLKVNVLGLGKLKKVEMFGNRGAAENGMFYPITDLYRSSKRAASPDKDNGTYSDINDYYNKTLTGRVAKAFENAGHNFSASDAGYCIQLHPTMVYNNEYYETGPAKFPNNTNSESVGGFETGDEDSAHVPIDPSLINDDEDLPSGRSLLE